MPESSTRTLLPAGKGTSRRASERVSSSSARSRPARLDAIWSMMPQRTPAWTISARCASWAMRTSSSGWRVRSRSARKVATSSAALDDSPTPIGTSESTRMSTGGTSMPIARASTRQPYT